MCPIQHKVSVKKHTSQAQAQVTRRDKDEAGPAPASLTPPATKKIKRRGFKTDPEPLKSTERGRFSPKDPIMNCEYIVPKGMTPMPRGGFTYKGKEYLVPTRDSTDKQWIKLAHASIHAIELIGDCFLKTKKGWFNANTFISFDL